MKKEQREKAIAEIIDNDIEGLYKYRDMFELLYNGCQGYKDMSDEEIIEYYEEREMDLPK